MEIDNYKFSSYNDYVNSDRSLVDIDFALSMMNKEEFIDFNNQINQNICLDYDEKNFRITDIDAKTIIKKISKCKNVAEFQLLDEKQRNKYIRKLRENGLSIRQISRLTGISKGIVERIT